MPRPARLPSPTRLRRGAVVLLLLVTLLAGAGVAVAFTRTGAPPVVTRDLTIDVPAGPGNSGQVRLDTTLYLPGNVPAPAVLLAHGFGSDKHAVAEEATDLAARGYVVLAWTARGFGRSTGQIGLDSPDYEVADARALVDWLSRRPEVTQDGPGDPRVGAAGASYGGGLALLLAGTDPRVDAIVPEVTWNDLAQALFPNAASREPVDAGTPAAGAFAPDGVFKRDWAGNFFGAGSTGPGLCGAFRPEFCAAYQQAATSGAPTPEIEALLRRSSPSSVNHRITAPTLLVQGEQDTLFGLDQADANARQIAANGTPVKVIWYSGGHDGAPPGQAVHEAAAAWFDHYLARTGEAPRTGFDYEVRGTFGTEDFGRRTVTVRAYPGLDGAGSGDPVQRRRLPLHGEPQQVVRPPGGSPAALTSLPGLGALSEAAGGAGAPLGADPPGQTATFVTDPLPEPLDVAGSAQVRLRVAAAGLDGAPRPDEAVLFVTLRDIGGGRSTLPGGAVAPVRIGPLPADGSPVEVTVTLAGVVRPVQAGHRLAVAVSTTDRGYALPAQPAGFTVSAAPAADGTGPRLAVPVVPGEQAPAPLPVGQLAGLGGLGALVATLAVVTAVRGRRRETPDPERSGVPLVVSGLSKSYPGGLTAVDDLSFRVERGQVLGLLGPNGAGKTTVLRMLMGLITPTSGELRVFGHPVRAGAAVLSRVGSFVEGSGFLPHLSGAENLRLYWAATGRPRADARVEEVLAVAGLGHAVERRVATYSQGMRQRLAIAQAMLGMPDLLVLDEPTNGLDPPQIHAMREVLREYAAGGRTVLVSSHLLAEVEQTCGHVVVMHHGRLVAAGTVAEVVATAAGAGDGAGDGVAGGDAARGHRLEEAFLNLVGREAVE